ncbi:HAMP domain-containing protein [Bradyrhizobium sp. 162]|uniref:HAMP domain-containing protein n=1 Tax=Bradyrhizobium sp. 162 TaxID=2782635 RepID=UPI001FFBD4D2|nr:HAMP domain-containing protein [Bradyrhizobium sp. 162]
MTSETLHDEVDDLGQIYDRIRPALVQIMAAADTHSQAVDMRAEEIRRNLIWIVGLATALVGLLALLFGRRIATTIVSMTTAMRQLGDGQFDVSLPGLGRRDELGRWPKRSKCSNWKRVKRHEPSSTRKPNRIMPPPCSRADIARLAGEFDAHRQHLIRFVGT